MVNGSIRVRYKIFYIRLSAFTNDGHHGLNKTWFFKGWYITPFNVSEDYLDSVQFCFDREVIVSWYNALQRGSQQGPSVNCDYPNPIWL